MIQKLRNPYVMKWGLYIIIGLTIPAFVLFYGFGTQQPAGPQIQGTLVTLKTDEGEIELSARDLERMQREAAEYYLQLAAIASGQQPQRGWYGMIQSALEPREVANFAVGQIAIEQRLTRQGIRITDDQVSMSLAEQGFTQESLQQFLQSRGMSEYELAARIRQEVKSSLAESTVERVARTSLLELWDNYVFQNEELSAEMARISVPFNSNEEVTEEEIAARYESLVEDQDSLVIDPAKKVYRYVKIPAPPPVAPYQPTEEELREAYDQALPEDEELYREGGKRVRQVLIRAPQGLSEEQREAAREKAEVARQRIVEGGEDFADVANDMSEDPRNRTGQQGEEDPELRGGVIPELFQGDQEEIDSYGVDMVDFINELEIGTVSPVLETPEGFAVAETTEEVEDRMMTFVEAKPVLRQRLRDQARQEQEQQRQAQIEENLELMREAVATQTTLEGIAEFTGTDVQVTSPTATTQTFIRGVGNLGSEEETLAGLSEGRISPMLQTDASDMVVLQVAEEIQEDLFTLDEIRSRIENQLTREKAVAKAKEKGEKIKARVQEGDSLTTAVLAVDPDLSVTSLDPFPRGGGQMPQELRMVQNANIELARAGEGDVLILEAGQGGMIFEVDVVHVTDVERPTMQQFMEEIRNYESALLGAKRLAYLEEYRRQAQNILEAEFSDVFNQSQEQNRRRE